jgi:hypothetical protein
MINWKPCRAKCDQGRYVIETYPAKYDVPVCPVCGGLGAESDDSYLALQIKKVREARFAHCPFDSREHFLFPPPPYLRLRALHEMLSALRTMQTYLGESLNTDCYAAVLVDGLLRDRIHGTNSEINDNLAAWRGGQVARPANEVLWHPMALAIDGRLDQAEAGLKSILHNDGPTSVETLLHVARFYVEYRRDWLTALKYLELARERFPAAAEVHMELVSAYDALHREAEMRLSFMDALDCPDIQDHPQLLRARRLIADRLGRSPLQLVRNEK